MTDVERIAREQNARMREILEDRLIDSGYCTREQLVAQKTEMFKSLGTVLERMNNV